MSTSEVNLTQQLLQRYDFYEELFERPQRTIYIYQNNIILPSPPSYTSILSLLFSYLGEKIYGDLKNLNYIALFIILAIEEYLTIDKRINVTRYNLDIYDMGEGEFSEPIPYIEVYVDIDDIDEMLNLWKDTLEELKKRFGEELYNIDIFFTRA
jgi:hypothetical protein